ncbi:MAG TPA: chemotaxis protein CheW [Patescibacteria group bacterium]|nr:chemotaxis protein CheW [Patescibacteria group bacterium]
MTLQILSFTLAGELCGIPALDVQTVIRASRHQLTPVPHAAAPVLGIMTLRGRIAAAISLRRCLGLPDPPLGAQNSMALVIEDGPEIYCLAVDSVGDVFRFDGDPAPPPASLGAGWRQFVTGVWPVGEALLAQIDARAIIATLAREVEAT